MHERDGAHPSASVTFTQSDSLGDDTFRALALVSLILPYGG